METLKKQNILEEVLAEYGYSGWFVIKPIAHNPETCLLFNPKEKKMGEISIPDVWLADPCRRSTIGELLASTIQNCSYALPQSQSASRLSRP